MARSALRTGLIGAALAGALGACGHAAPSTTSTPATPTASPSLLPAPSPTPSPAPLIVTARDTGPAESPWTAVQLSLLSEDGTLIGTFNDPGGVDGDAYTVGSGAVYFIDGTVVKALGRSGTVTDVGGVPQVPTTVNADDLQTYTTFAVSPDQTTFIFGIPLAIQGDHGATSDHSQLWSEPVGGTALSATMVYDDTNSTDSVLLPVAWGPGGVVVSQRSTTGLGGAGPFINYTYFEPATFDPTTHSLTPVQGNCLPANPQADDAPAPTYVCKSLVPSSPDVTVDIGSETATVTMHAAGATAFGSVVVSDDDRYLAYGAYIGNFGSGHYVTTIVDLTDGATVATISGFTPMQWLDDDRLVVSPLYLGPSTALLSPSFNAPVELSADQPTGALP